MGSKALLALERSLAIGACHSYHLTIPAQLCTRKVMESRDEKAEMKKQIADARQVAYRQVALARQGESNRYLVRSFGDCVWADNDNNITSYK
jgi:hypothetical protein